MDNMDNMDNKLWIINCDLAGQKSKKKEKLCLVIFIIHIRTFISWI